MKKLLLVLLLLPAVVIAQKTDTIPFKDCDRIIIKNNLSAEENFKMIQKSLVNHEIEILNANAEAHQVKSGMISLNNAMMPAANYYLVCFAKDNQLSLKAYFKSGVSAGGFIKIEDGYQIAKYFKPKKRNLIFEKMKLLSKDIPGQTFYAAEN